MTLKAQKLRSLLRHIFLKWRPEFMLWMIYGPVDVKRSVLTFRTMIVVRTHFIQNADINRTIYGCRCRWSLRTRMFVLWPGSRTEVSLSMNSVTKPINQFSMNLGTTKFVMAKCAVMKFAAMSAIAVSISGKRGNGLGRNRIPFLWILLYNCLYSLLNLSYR